ncbi:ABC transporter permease [Amycolatopsis suaedae]|uniref:Transport permease protein n=1 Tax=Amycolatopsis suaedae TaxID=2510978 RepID=A0A4Q7JF72_9PSEU|nr:ABC transporter permease [Amycolatopsis suaedae]RZQ65822.1 ABC transporter permease [Amycolatopsis suaedae]
MSATQRWRPPGFAAQVRILAARSLRGGLGDRRLLVAGLLQPIVILLLFSQVFQAVGTLPGMVRYAGYVNFLIPATLINIALAGALASGSGHLAETYSGFVGRLRTLPVDLPALLIARTVTDTVRSAAQLVVAVLTALAVFGYRPAGVLATLALLGFAVFVGWGLGWLFVALATWQQRPDVMQLTSFLVLFPMMFASSAYLPVELMPGWLRIVATVNPLTHAIDAARDLSLGRASGSSLGVALALVGAVAVLGFAVAARNLRRR